MTKRLILAGAGHAHLVTLERLAHEAPIGLEILLITPSQFQYYSGMLPGWIAGAYSPEDCRIDILPVAKRAGVKVILQSLVALDAANRQITLTDNTVLDFDYLSLDIGAEARNPWAEGLSNRLVAAKPLDRFQEDWTDILKNARGRQSFRLAVVGGGAAGVELSLVCNTALRAAGVRPDMALVTGDRGLLHEHGPAVQKRGEAALRRSDIRLVSGRAHVEGGSMRLSSGEHLQPDCVIAATGAYAPAWLKTTGLALDQQGFVATDAELRSISHPTIFATGDISSRTDVDIPRSGVHAVRAGPILAENLLAVALGGILKPYQPRRHSLYIMASGEKTAIASWGNLSVEGQWVWRWKDFIDRRFMRRFQQVGD